MNLQVIVAKARARAYEIRKAAAEEEADAAGEAKLAELASDLDAQLAALDALGDEPDDAVAKADGAFDEDLHPRGEGGRFGSGGGGAAAAPKPEKPLGTDKKGLGRSKAAGVARDTSHAAKAASDAAKASTGPGMVRAHDAAWQAHAAAAKQHEEAAARSRKPEFREAHLAVAKAHADLAAEHDMVASHMANRLGDAARASTRSADALGERARDKYASGSFREAANLHEQAAEAHGTALVAHDKAQAFSRDTPSSEAHDAAAERHVDEADWHRTAAIDARDRANTAEVEHRASASSGPAVDMVPPGTLSYHAERLGIEHDLGPSALRDVFGEKAPSFESLERTWGSGEHGISIKIRSIETDRMPNGNAVKYLSEIMKDGKKIGECDRSFVRRPDGKLEARHDYFKLDVTGEQSKGLGAAMMKQSIQAYEKMGVDQITTHAAWVGQYTWASMGYNWNKEEAAQREPALRSFLVKHGVEPERAAGLAKAAAPRAWDVAGLDVDGKKASVYVEEGGGEAEHTLGKAFLLQGDDWYGKMSLDKADPTYQRAKKRLGL